MAKQNYMKQKSIQDAMMIDSQDSNEEDNQTSLFQNFVEFEIIKHVRDVPFYRIISRHLNADGARHEFIIRRIDIPWYCEADRRTVQQNRTVFTFRFPNLDFSNSSYDGFEIDNNSLFIPSDGYYHRVNQWWEFRGSNFCQYIRNLLPGFQRENETCRTRIFINKKWKRTDIVFNFDTTNRRIIMTFEDADPKRPTQNTNYWY
ncbi:hypothetical protein I4U23_005152 [Adineta vaga]|nr:hypothetical protein I4U23_005152 [Adineta vaga]